MGNEQEKPVLHNVKLEGLEAFFVMQLIDSCQIKGSEAQRIWALREKFQKALEVHYKKTGEYIGYNPTDAVANAGAK